MQYQKTDGIYLLKIDRGESVLSTITEFCQAQHIQNATISGLGAVSWLSCGYYALSEKRYYFTTYDELLEVVSLTGNVMLKDGQPFVHLHGVFTNTKNEAFGGHIEEMKVGVVLEVVLTPLSSAIARVRHEEIGLALMEMEEESGTLTDGKTPV